MYTTHCKVYVTQVLFSFFFCHLPHQPVNTQNMNGDKIHHWPTADVVTRNQYDVDLSCLTEYLNSSYISFMILIIFDSIPYFFFIFQSLKRCTLSKPSQSQQYVYTICIYKDDLHSQLCSMMIRKQNNFLNDLFFLNQVPFFKYL